MFKLIRIAYDGLYNPQLRNLYNTVIQRPFTRHDLFKTRNMLRVLYVINRFHDALKYLSQKQHINRNLVIKIKRVNQTRLKVSLH